MPIPCLPSNLVNRARRFAFGAGLLAAGLSFSGCVAIPPLIQVQHRESSNVDLAKKLDAIERRLDRIEDKVEPKAQH